MRYPGIAALSAVLSVQPLAAQPLSLTTAKGKAVQIGYYSFPKNDCSGGARPDFKNATPMEHGQLIVKPATLATKRLKQCGEVKVPAIVVFYQADPQFVGSMPLAFDVVNSDTGEAHRISATVRVAGDAT